MKNFANSSDLELLAKSVPIQFVHQMTGDLPSVGPPGPVGCGGAIFVMSVVLIALALFGWLVWFIVRDLPQ